MVARYPDEIHLLDYFGLFMFVYSARMHDLFPGLRKIYGVTKSWFC